MSALGRLKSNSWRDKLFGILYYSMLISIPVMGWFSITEFLKTNLYTWLCILAYAIVFAGINLPVVGDYSNTKKSHKGTINYFLGVVNPTKFNNVLSRHIHKITQQENSEPVFAILSIFTSCALSFFGFVNALLSESYFFLIFAISSFTLPALTLFIHSNFINSQIVPVENLNLIFEMNEITEDEKKAFSNAIKQIISSKGYVTRNDVFRHSDFIIRNNEMRKLLSKKQKNREHYSSFFNRSE